jgi:hypothetical protein
MKITKYLIQNPMGGGGKGGEEREGRGGERKGGRGGGEGGSKSSFDKPMT